MRCAVLCCLVVRHEKTTTEQKPRNQTHTLGKSSSQKSTSMTAENKASFSNGSASTQNELRGIRGRGVAAAKFWGEEITLASSVADEYLNCKSPAYPAQLITQAQSLDFTKSASISISRDGTNSTSSKQTCSHTPVRYG